MSEINNERQKVQQCVIYNTWLKIFNKFLNQCRLISIGILWHSRKVLKISIRNMTFEYTYVKWVRDWLDEGVGSEEGRVAMNNILKRYGDNFFIPGHNELISTNTKYICIHCVILMSSNYMKYKYQSNV